MTRRRAASAHEPVLDAAPERGTAPAGRDALARPGHAGRWRAIALAASVALHGSALAALVLWPIRDPVEEPGEIASVALVFDDTASGAGSAQAAAEPPVPPSPPAPPPVMPAPPSPPAPPQAAAPPPPPPPPAPPPAATASPASPEAPRDVAALPPDPSGTLPPPPEAAGPAVVPVPPAPAQAVAAPPAPVAEAPRPPPTEAEPVPQPEARQVAAGQEPAPEADPLPLPPPSPPPPPQQVAAAQPPRPPRAAAAQGPVRLDAGGGDMADASLGSFAIGAVVPPSTDAGHRNNPPDYPAEARRRGQEGIVRLTLRISQDGRVVGSEVDVSSGVAALDQAAVEATRRWRFRPAMRAGMPVAATLSTAVHFRLTDGRGR